MNDYPHTVRIYPLTSATGLDQRRRVGEIVEWGYDQQHPPHEVATVILADLIRHHPGSGPR